MAGGRLTRVGDNDEIIFLERCTQTSVAGDRPDYRESAEFTMPWWSQAEFGAEGSCTWMSLIVASNEVARVMLEPRDAFSRWFAIKTPDSFMEVVFFEVAVSQRRRTLGTRIVAELEKRYPYRTLAAVSQDCHSDAFWSAVKWRRYQHSALADFRPVYISPLQSGLRSSGSQIDPVQSANDI